MDHSLADLGVILSEPRSRHVAVFLVVLLVGTLVVGLDVALCPLAGLVGIPCPSCGLIRATMAVLSGDFRRAYALHPGALPVLTYLAVAAAGWANWRHRAIFVTLMSFSGIALLGCLTLLWVARFFGSFGGPVPVHPWRFW